MITRLVLAAAAALALSVSSALPVEPAFPILYLSRADDPAYQPHPGYTGLSLRDRKPPVVGARLAMRGSRIRGRALGLHFELRETELPTGADPVEAVKASGAKVAILDLPLDQMQAVTAALGKRDDLILFNIRHREDSLRAAGCAPALFDTIPSRAMLADALSQFLVKRNWRRVLILRGPDPASAARAKAFAHSARKFGLNVVETKVFEDTNDPRKRALGNIALLTGGADYDVVYVADEIGDFGRYVQYQTYAPRPVVGTEGLTPVTWHWTFERYGAPQLNQRFERSYHRKMQAEDWAAWAAVRAVVEAVTRTRSTDVAKLRAYMQSPDFSLDLYKGAPGGFRPWTGQLRQPILLAVHNAVIAVAPLPGFLHRTNNLDTLGIDAPEAKCPARRG